MFELKETLWLTADRRKAVKDGDKDAAFLLGRAGTKITDLAAEKLGLKKSEPGSVANRDPVVTHRDAIESRNEAAKIATQDGRKAYQASVSPAPVKSPK